MRRTVGASGMIIVVLTCCAPAQVVKESPEEILSRFPSEIRGFGKDQIEVYPERELGASVTYRWAGEEGQWSTMTFYLYDLGSPRVQGGARSALVKLCMEEAKDEIFELEKGTPRYRGLVLIEERLIDIGSEPGSIRMLYVSYAGGLIVEPEICLPCYTEIYLTAHKNYVCKFRITRSAAGSDEETRIAMAALFSHW